jgi:hypothetical protein
MSVEETLMNANASQTTKIKTHFAKIIVEGTAEHPYYGIMFFNPADGEYHVGYGSYYIGNVFQWFAEEFEIVYKYTNVLTNADRIRAMSDEELAEDFCKTVLSIMEQLGVENTGSIEDAVRIRLEWLKQPTKESDKQ